MPPNSSSQHTLLLLLALRAGILLLLVCAHTHTTGTLKDLYVTLARVAKLAPMAAPGEQMVAAKLRQGQFGGLTTFEDPMQRISELGRDAHNEVLLVYYYSNPEDGPAGHGGDNKKVLVFHRYAGMRGADGKFSAPLLLWLPPSETYDPQLHVQKIGGSSTQQQLGSGGGRQLGGSEIEYAVTEEAPLWTHVRRMLQPFQAPPALCQHTAATAVEGSAAAAGGGSSSGGAAQQQQEQEQDQGAAGAGAVGSGQQPVASTGPADVSMAAASALPASPTASPSPEPCCTSQPAAACAAPAAAGTSSGGPGGAWGSDGGAADQTNNKAASEAGDNNSTWGSHGSDLAHSDMDIGDLGCDEAIDEAADEAVGISRAASRQQLADEQQQQQPAAAAGQRGGGGSGSGGGAAVDMESDGELDAGAALAAEQLGTSSGLHNSPTAAAGAALGSSGVGTLVSGGVQVAPLDLWAPQSQVRSFGRAVGPRNWEW